MMRNGERLTTLEREAADMATQRTGQTGLQPDGSRAQSVYIGIDIGGTKIEGVIIDGAGTALESRRDDSDHGDTAVAEQIVALIAQLSAVATRRGWALAGIGVGIPGTIDAQTGEVSNAVNLGIAGFNLRNRIAEEIPDTPIRIENDVNAAAFGAWTVLGRECADDQGPMVLLNFGTGLACGIVSGGHVYHGSTGIAGEIGHIPVEPHRYPCKCGQQGCLETVASGSAVARIWPTDAGYPLPELMRAAAHGDHHAHECLATVIHGMSTAIMIIAMSVDPGTIVLGGGLAKTGQPLLDAITTDLRDRARSSSFVASLELPQRLMLAPMSQPIGAIGAAAVAIARQHADSSAQ
ncbi:ROK family protein [Bifidobacterium mongoliense]|uniref:ROK family protein n=1 Tax=Bifidobacterium mongoliense TaxID=518643 RepID=UPI0030EC79FD